MVKVNSLGNNKFLAFVGEHFNFRLGIIPFLAASLMLGSSNNAMAQISSVPAFPSEDQPITIYFNAKEGNKGLLGFNGEVYIHTGVITDESEQGNSSDWRYVVTDWGVNTPGTRLTRIEPDLFRLTISNIREFYSVPEGEEILSLAMVFRSADSKLEGKGGNGTDLFIKLYQEGVHVRFEKPVEATTVLQSGETLEIQVLAAAIGSELDRIRLFENGTEVENSTTDSLLFTATANEVGQTELMAVSSNTSGETDTAYVYYVIPSEVENVPRPTGLQEGITYYPDDPSKVTLSLLAPYKERVYVIGEFNNWQVHPDYQMKRDTRGSQEVYWWLEIGGLEPGKEYAFQYYVDEEIKIADPYSEKVLHPDDSWIEGETYPNLKPYPKGETTEYVSVLQTNKPEFDWTDQDWQRPNPEKLVIYELLVRDFSEDHNFATVIDSLDYLKQLGINAIELMPVNEFEGNNSWGYNPAFYFAPDRYYGPEEDLKRLINEAHNRGIAVILDAVYNHSFGQSPMVRLYNEGNYGKPTPQNIWFNTDARHPFNVGYDFNHESTFTQRFIDRVNQYWLEEYHIDGYRYDLSKGFTQNFTSDVGGWNQYDQSRINLLIRMKNEIQKVDPNAYLILEHLGNNDEEKVLADNGFLLWGIMHDPFKEAAMGYSGDLSGVSYQSRGWNDPHLVGYMESHDEERVMYELKNYGNSVSGYDTKDENTSLNRMKLAHAFLMAVPGPKMFWQFGELGYDISVEENGRTGEKPILWEYRHNPDRYRLYQTMAEMNKLKTTVSAFSSTDYEIDLGGKQKKVLLKSGTDVQVLGNFDVISADVWPYAHNSGSGKWWYEYFSGDSLQISADNTTPINMAPGELRVYSTSKLGMPPPGLLDATAPSLSLSSATVNFNEIQGSGDPPFERNLKVTNTGSAPLIITDISSFSNVFEVSPKSATIQPGEDLDLAITFHPLTTGDFEDIFLIESVNAVNKSFTVIGHYSDPLPDVPELTTPADRAKKLPLKMEFSWVPVQSADSYDLEIITTANGTVVVSESELLQTTFSDVDLLHATEYQWRVRAVNSFGESSWSPFRSFTTMAPIPEAVILQAPGMDLSGVSTSPVLQWQETAFADKYELQLATDVTFEDIITIEDDIENIRFQKSGLSANEQYYWRVRASNASGTGTWSEIWNFTTSAIGTPLLVYPVNDQVNVATDDSLVWNAAVNAEHYDIQISKQEDFKIRALETGLSDTLFRPDFLERNTVYYWRVKSIGINTESDFSATRVFTTVFDVPGIPVLKSPADNAQKIPDTFTLEWNGAALTMGYQVQVSEDDSFNSPVIDTVQSEKLDFIVEDELSRGTQYFWRVRSVNPSHTSAWSDTLSFHTLSEAPFAPELVSPADSVTNLSREVTFRWRSAGSQSEYRFQLSEDQAFNQKMDSSAIADTSIVLNELKFNQTYYWRVRASNEGGNSSWTEIRLFRTTVEAPGEVSVVEPLSADLVHPRENKFVWTKVARASTYRFQISTDIDFETMVKDTANITSQKLENIRLTGESTYFWRVQAVNRAGTGSWSEVQEIQTKLITSIKRNGIPTEFALQQNYPNPFNPSTVISYALPEPTEVLLEVFNVMGQKVLTLVNKRESAGYHSVQFNAGDLSSGLYLYRLKAGNFIRIKKLMLIK